jgi:hypothetical protein
VDGDPVVAAFFEESRVDEAQRVAFLQKMPKGANIHQHVAGGV